jgi:thiol-disulfide isomerase/thioredoxin
MPNRSAPRSFSRPLAQLGALLVLAGLASGSLAADPTLGIGDEAPRLEVSRWVKGDPVKEIEKGKIYVVEFWATWCGPCRQTIPHLTELQEQYKDVIFIGQDVFEEDESGVVPFVNTMGDRMKYRVAMDDKSKIDEGAMAAKWMKASGQDGIPTAFIINKDSRIAWVGHPMQMEAPLKAVVAGTHDMEKAKAAAAVQKKLNKALQTRDLDAALKLTDELVAADPAQGDTIEMLRFQILSAKRDYATAAKKAAEIGDKMKDDVDALNQVAWMIAADPNNPSPDLDLAMKLATRANEKSEGKNAGVLDTLAAVYAKKGDNAKAVELQTKAVELALEPQEKAQLQQALDNYKKAAAGK